MSSLRTDAIALACILAGGAAGTAVTLAALDRDEAGRETACAVERAAAPRITVTYMNREAPATAVVSGERSCVAVRSVVVHRARAEATRARMEAQQRRLEARKRELEHTSGVLKLQVRELEREVAAAERAQRDAVAAKVLEALGRESRERR